jgi:hypothetical protein
MVVNFIHDDVLVHKELTLIHTWPRHKLIRKLFASCTESLQNTFGDGCFSLTVSLERLLTFSFQSLTFSSLLQYEVLAEAKMSTGIRFPSFLGAQTNGQRLVEAVQIRMIPADPQTYDDFLFSLCGQDPRQCDHAYLLTFYRYLINERNVTADMLDIWCQNDILLQSFEQHPKPDLHIERLLAILGTEKANMENKMTNTPPDPMEWLSRAMTCLLDRERIDDLQIIPARHCYMAYGVFLRGGSLEQDWHGAGLPMWYNFGFGLCRDANETNQLHRWYALMIRGDHGFIGIDNNNNTPLPPVCSFFELRMAYMTGGLYELMRRYAVADDFNPQIPGLMEFLRAPMTLGQRFRPSQGRGT